LRKRISEWDESREEEYKKEEIRDGESGEGGRREDRILSMRVFSLEGSSGRGESLRISNSSFSSHRITPSNPSIPSTPSLSIPTKKGKGLSRHSSNYSGNILINKCTHSKG